MALILFITTGVFNLFGQTSSVIKMMPHHAQGYLILHKSNDIDYWRVEILKRNYDSTGYFYDDLEERYELIGRNYFQIPYNIINDCGQPGYKYVISATAHYSGGASFTEESVLDFPPSNVPQEDAYESVYQWKCNGNTYAWSIHQMLANNSYFTLQPLVKSYTNQIVEYYYQYFSESEWVDFFVPSLEFPNSGEISNTLYSDYYSVPPGNIGLIDGIQQIKIPNSPSITYKDQYGVAINSNWVYGIARGLGPWGGASGQSCTWTSTFPFGNSMGYMSKSWAIQKINQYSGLVVSCGKPLLECIDWANTSTPVHPSNTYDLPSADSSTLAKLSKLELDSIVWIWGEIENMSDSIFHPNWWDYYHGFSIVD